MRCVYCRERAGLFRKLCSQCAKVVALIDKAAGHIGLRELVDLFVAEGLTEQRVNRVFDTPIGDQPTIRDRLTSQMANALMRNLGMPGRQSPADVQRLRVASQAGSGAGTWVRGEQPPGSN